MNYFQRTKYELQCEECGIYGAGPYTGLCNTCYSRKYGRFRRDRWKKIVGPRLSSPEDDPETPPIANVRFTVDCGTKYWVAFWGVGPLGKRKHASKMFAIPKYGNKEAYRLAIEARDQGQWEDYLDNYINKLKKADKISNAATIDEVRKEMMTRRYIMVWVAEMDIFVTVPKAEFRHSIKFGGGLYEFLLYELYANEEHGGTLFVKVAKK